jgi:hypothetical protein
MNIKSFIFLFIGILLVAPLLVSADELNTYQFSDSGNYVHYEGLVPCGKDLWISSDEAGLNDVIMGHVPCQFCHIFIMLATIMGFLLTRLIPILAVGMLLVAGIMYYLALGNPEKFKKVNKVFSGVLIGLVLIYGAWLIIGALFSILGVAEWTGLQSGWYQINCPVKHVVYDAKEGGSAPQICDGKYGPEPLPGFLCVPGGVLSPTLGAMSWCAAVKKCDEYTGLDQPEGSWELMSIFTHSRLKSPFRQFLECGNCTSWDLNCCKGDSHDRAYWALENEMTADGVLASGRARASWYYEDKYNKPPSLEPKACTWDEWRELGANQLHLSLWNTEKSTKLRSVRCILPQ